MGFLDVLFQRRIAPSPDTGRDNWSSTYHTMLQYPRVIVTMAQNLIAFAAASEQSAPPIHENKYYMLYNAILTHHFPLDLEYGIAPQSSIIGTGEYLVVKVAREQESIVLVVEAKKPIHDTPGGRATVKKELIDYIEECLDETIYSTIYGIGCIGLAWVCYKMDRTGSGDPELVYDWTANITSAGAYESMKQLAERIHTMTGTART